jgi:uncharacterized phiE125 gp8 family phage protein
MDCVGYKITTEPITEPVTATEMRAYLRLADTSQDTLIDALVASARSTLEKTTGRIFCTSVYEVLFEDFDDDAEYPELRLPVTPAQSITSVYYDVSGVSTLLAGTQYKLRGYAMFPSIVPAYGVSWPIADADTVIVKVSAGVATTGVYDKIGCAIIKALVADLFENPEGNIEKSMSENRTIERMMQSWRTR